jgi:hypothetical protein
MFFIIFLLVEGRIRSRQNITDTDPGGPKHTEYYGSGSRRPQNIRILQIRIWNTGLPVSTDSVSLARGVSFMICRASKGSCVDVSRMLEQSTSLKQRTLVRIIPHPYLPDPHYVHADPNTEF